MKSTLLETHAPKQEEGGGGGARDWLQEDKVVKETATTPTCFLNNLELRLGISLSNNNNNKEFIDVVTNTTTKAGALATNPNPSMLLTTLDGLVLNGFVPSGRPSETSSTITTTTKRWFTAEPSCSVGFIHPWSLAARQQKAVFEKAHQRSAAVNPSSSSTPAVPRFTLPAPPPPPIVGWPPVRASRRNLVSPSPTKPEMDDEKDAKKAKVSEDGENKRLAEPGTMFVKVNMEGFAVGRKINLKAHDSYESLSRALQKMFVNFLSTNYTNNSLQEEQVADHNNPDYILLYEDHEGDRMLVGDVPYELFMTSVKRLYIAHSPKAPKSDDEKDADDKNCASAHMTDQK